MDGPRHRRQRVAAARERRADPVSAHGHDHVQLPRDGDGRNHRAAGVDRQRRPLRDRRQHGPREELGGRVVWIMRMTPEAMRGVLRRPSQSGFTLLECLVAMFLLAVGLSGAATVVSTQLRGGVAAAATGGMGAINRSNGISTATMLAQEKIEQLKHDAQWRGTGTPLPAIGSSVLSSSTSCGGTVTSGICIETQVINFDTCLPASSATSRVVTVSVTYKAAGDVGTKLGGKVTLSTIIAQRP
ncbi:MAG: hypothetical protein DMD81_09240 [Candidatus Rokuibacteriota bacterium]|nr:MAG: hypothetical protein DMD81_09240 [Candidatus Rokubacteria bacterium]